MQNEQSTNAHGIYSHGKMVNNKYYNKSRNYNYQILTIKMSNNVIQQFK